MKKIIAFGGSNSKSSINKEFANYTANKIENVEVEVLDLNDFDLPIYSIDVENESGIPANAKSFANKIKEADGIVISLAEHNGTYTAVFKNLLDWISRIEKSVFHDKPMLLMATSPGGRGGQTVLETAINSFPRFGANVVSTFSLPSFYDNFKESELVNEDLLNQLNKQVTEFNNVLINN